MRMSLPLYEKAGRQEIECEKWELETGKLETPEEILYVMSTDLSPGGFTEQRVVSFTHVGLHADGCHRCIKT